MIIKTFRPLTFLGPFNALQFLVLQSHNAVVDSAPMDALNAPVVTFFEGDNSAVGYVTPFSINGGLLGSTFYQVSFHTYPFLLYLYSLSFTMFGAMTSRSYGDIGHATAYLPDLLWSSEITMFSCCCCCHLRRLGTMKQRTDFLRPEEIFGLYTAAHPPLPA